jgi:hypothetical protein
MHFIKVLERVHSLLRSLRVRRNFEITVRKAGKTAQSTTPQPAIDQEVLEESIETFKSQEQADKLSNDYLFRRQRETNLEVEYILHLACYETDANGLRSLCNFFWKL